MNAKETGSYYTPDYIAQYIVNRALHAWLKDCIGYDYNQIETLGNSEKKKILERVRGVRILDPAVGEGVFLYTVANSLLNLRRLLGDSKSDDRIREDIIKCLYGVDIVEDALRKCIENLRNWMGNTGTYAEILNNIKIGNSLIGFCGIKFPTGQPIVNFRNLLHSSGVEIHDKELRKTKPFHWVENFPQVMKEEVKGFDIVVGNPPYGNILSVTEREIISSIYPFCVGGGRSGTWNAAAHFVVRAKMLLQKGGQLGFLLPNSVLRVGQFTKTRQFLLNEMTLHEIVDEGSPFPDVTLEMVSVFCKSESHSSDHDVKVITRREDVKANQMVPWSVFNNSKIFVLYYDDIYKNILKKSERHVLTAGRGRDIPAEHVSDKKDSPFEIPYATTGRSVQRYRFDYEHIKYTDNWYEGDRGLIESYSNEFLVATKNLPYPRCVMKPVGMLHGGGLVRIEPFGDDVDLAAIGLILNSNLMKYICIRYLTNYSELTTCMNTGIMEDMPIIIPENPATFARLFRALEILHSEENRFSENREIRPYLEMVANALVYSLYISDNRELIQNVVLALQSTKSNHYIKLYELLSDSEILQCVKNVLKNPLVVSIEHSPRMN